MRTSSRLALLAVLATVLAVAAGDCSNIWAPLQACSGWAARPLYLAMPMHRRLLMLRRAA